MLKYTWEKKIKQQKQTKNPNKQATKQKRNLNSQKHLEQKEQSRRHPNT
jgi:hypothetical protein